MSEKDRVLSRLSRFTAFSTLGIIGTTQDLARLALEHVENSDAEKVAEETLCLVAVTSARAAEVGLRQEPQISSMVVPTILDLPFAYRDYLVGGAMITQRDTSLLDANEAAYKRLQTIRAFYAGHFPENRFPSEPVVRSKMETWIERYSLPSLAVTPAERLQQQAFVHVLMTHLKLTLAFGRQG
ncbi:MAG: hypothetical protein R2834_17255 [Rhodothermales bacterium]